MRTYSEREVSAIIERAVERQHAVEEGASDAGLTLDEIERLGREAGIDPAHLRAAAAEVDEAGRTLSRQSGQTRTHVYVERWVDAPFSEAGWEDAVALLRTAFGATIGAPFGSAAGETVQRVGQSVEWSHTSSLGIQTRVTVSPRGNRTRLHATQLVGLASPAVEGVGYGGLIALVLAVLGGAIGGGLSGSAGVTVVAALLTFLIAWAAAAPLVAAADRRWRARKLRDLGALADEIVPVLRASASEEPVAAEERSAPTGRVVPDEPVEARPAAAFEAGLLDLDALPDEAPDAENVGAARRPVR